MRVSNPILRKQGPESHCGRSLHLLFRYSCYNVVLDTNGEEGAYDACSILICTHKQRTTSSAPVLVIDDEESIIDLIKLGLKYEGFEVVAASDGEEGIAAAQRINPLFIILDWMLPDTDGLVVCRRLRSNPTTRDIPILLLTAKDEVGSRVEGLNTGADDYLTKPFSFEELVARIRAILRRLNHSSTADTSQVLQVGDLELNMATHEVTRAGRSSM